MTETILKSLMRLFAIAANINSDIHNKARKIIESYLRNQVKKEVVQQYLVMFDYYNNKFKAQDEKKSRKQLSLNSVRVLMICDEINKELPQRQKIVILLELFEVIGSSKKISSMELDFVKTVSDSLKIPEIEYENCKAFVFGKYDEIRDKSNLLIADKKKYLDDPEIKHLERDNLEGRIYFLQVKSTNTYVFKLEGKDELYLNGLLVQKRKVYIFTKGSSIQSLKVSIHSLQMSPVYYSDIVTRFLSVDESQHITFTAKEVAFTYKNSKSGIRNLNFSSRSGQFIGIMGVSGVGKTTFLNLLNGNLSPDEGQVLINGYDIHLHKNKLTGLIGYVPQDDLLMEELTVYQNLFFNAKLCFSDYSESQIKAAIDKTLSDLDLYEVRGQKVGTPLKNYISGGQRKRLNIAMELIREPSILLVDEPTSGLSSRDSENVIELLKEQTLKGKLVIANIHKPSSDSFKLFDKLMVLDVGGLPIYYGNPIDSIIYFKTLSHHVDPTESECLRCGNINTEQILDIVETRAIDEMGEYSNKRKVSALDWHEEYLENIQGELKIDDSLKEVPRSNFKIPNVFKQFSIFFQRNLFSKVTDLQYILISLLEAPALALILAFFTKFNKGTEADQTKYIFSANENLPAYIFMSIVVALFLGLSMSAEEIIKDRRTLKRESFLHLSRNWYLLSKIVFLFAMSAIQMFTYVIIGNSILEIKGLNFEYWLMLFSVACFTNLLGLNISSAFKSVITIYIMIPFILIPQLLLSGTIVKFDKLHSSVTSYEYVPFIGDVMASRWAYEGLMVNQFKNNQYQEHIFEIEQKESNASYRSTYLIPELLGLLEQSRRSAFIEKDEKATNEKLVILESELKKLFENITEIKFSLPVESLDYDSFTNDVYKQIFSDLQISRNITNSKLNEFLAQKDQVMLALKDEYDQRGQHFYQVKEEHYNDRLAEIVLNRKEIDKVMIKEGKVIRKFEPVYFVPESRFGRAQFFAGEKRFFNHTVDTFYLNLAVIWAMSLFMYLALANNLLKKLISVSRKNKIKPRDPDAPLANPEVEDEADTIQKVH